MNNKERLFSNRKCLIGMVHCLPLPGTMGFAGNIEKIYTQAVEDAKKLEKAGYDAIIVENMGDAPFGAKLTEEQKAALTVAAILVKQNVSIPVGIDAAFNDYMAGLAIAKAVSAAMVRIPVFVDTVVTSCGILYPCAREAVRYRKDIDAQDILLLADVQVKHSHMLIGDIKIEESAKMAEENGADVIIVTGAQIGMETPIDAIKSVKEHAKVPVIAGSGFNAKNGKEQLLVADGAIIGSSLKQNGKISNPIDQTLAENVIKAVR